MYRCFTAFSFIFLGLLFKTILSVGIFGTMDSVAGNTVVDLFDKLTSTIFDCFFAWGNLRIFHKYFYPGSKFVKPIVFRGIMAAIFQIIGWSIVGIAANEDFG